MAGDHTGGDGDLALSEVPVTVPTFFRGRHFSVSDHMEKALAGPVPQDGEKIARAPVAATDAMIAETESRLGVTLPDTLRSLYRLSDGGSLPSYWVPATADPGSDFDDWIDAFAYDYNDLRPLQQLHFLIEDYLEDFDPDHNDESDKEDWFPDADKLVVLTRRYGVATLLDYRHGSTDPGVLLVDVEEEDAEARVRKRYDSFDAFFAALRKEDEDGLFEESPAGVERARLADHGVDAALPGQFWADTPSNARRGVGAGDWQAAEARLGVPLPASFRELYAVLDGGAPGHPFVAGLGADEHGEPRSPFAGDARTMLPLAASISLADLSERLSFPAATPYAHLHEGADRLIVVSASFDAALLLDYRGGTEPRVVRCPDLMRPESCVDLGPPTAFLEALRQRAHPGPSDALPVADRRLAPRVASVETFWMAGADGHGATDEALAGFARRVGAEVPEAFVPFLKARNGGAVRFRFAPPLVATRHPMVDPQAHRRSPDWVDVFPGGVWPVEEWIDFAGFRRRHAVALDQDPRDDLMPDMGTDAKLVERLLVIGADGHGAITLLDLSTGSYRKNTALSRADYLPATDRYRLAVAPAIIQHYHQGALLTLRARMDDLG